MSKDLIPQPPKGNVVKGAIRALSPNAIWDAIKNADRVVRWTIGGGAMIGTLATAVIQRLQGLPQDVIGILLIAFLWLLALTLFYSVSWYKRRRAQPTGEREAVTEQPATEPTEVDFKNLLYVYPLAFFTTLISEGYIGFQIQVFNGSPYDVTIENDVRGYILMNDKPFPEKPILTVTKGSPPEDRLTALDMRQVLDEQTAKGIDEALKRGEAFSFTFTNLDIYFVAQLPSGQVRRRLHLPDGVHCKAGIISSHLKLIYARDTAKAHD